MTIEEYRILQDALGQLEARQWRDSNGKEIIGALWIRRDDVAELLIKKLPPLEEVGDAKP